MGGGSNILFTEDYKGTVVDIKNKGIHVVEETKNHVFIKASAGEVWDDFVSFCVINEYVGVENLSLIPGRVGASPVQNIGAYGVEAKDVIHSVGAINIETLREKSFSNNECNFAYRESIFKNLLNSQYIITDVIFKLSKKAEFKIDYGTIRSELKNFSNINLKSIRQAVVNIRQSKLPDIENLPNAGSFFKNPVIEEYHYKKLKGNFPELVSYKADNCKVKLAAGQLIDLCGWKGEREGDVGVHDKQALVIVNYGDATGVEILNFSQRIQKSVFDEFNVKIQREVIAV